MYIYYIYILPIHDPNKQFARGDIGSRGRCTAIPNGPRPSASGDARVRTEDPLRLLEGRLHQRNRTRGGAERGEQLDQRQALFQVPLDNPDGAYRLRAFPQELVQASPAHEHRDLHAASHVCEGVGVRLARIAWWRETELRQEGVLHHLQPEGLRCDANCHDVSSRVDSYAAQQKRTKTTLLDAICDNTTQILMCQ